MVKKTATPATDSLFDSSELSELDRAREDLKGLSGELTRLNDRHMILLKERSQWEKSAYAAAEREAWRKVSFNHQLYVFPRVREPFAMLCGRIEMLPDRPKPDQVEQLKRAAKDVAAALKGAAEDPETSGLLDEVAWLREAVRVQGVRLHDRYGPEPSGEGCACPGCELIRSLDARRTT